ncbi:MAG TPA: hypothetical protein VKR22_09055 [Acidimicrobiales bacterium]|nr:hypothetical protein [Acidimicrobiales bacterium]
MPRPYPPEFRQRAVELARRHEKLPTRQVELAVRGGGRVLGTFILTPTPATPISQEQCVVAVALVDQLGAALAAHEID